MADRTRLESLREAKNWTQAEVAERLGITQGSYSLIASGKRTPSLVTALKISDLFGAPIEELFPDLIYDNSQSSKGDESCG